MSSAPNARTTGHQPLYASQRGTIVVRFYGRFQDPPGALANDLLGATPAWLEQIHSATVRRARHGHSGTGDALFSDGSGLALTVATADCVPVLLASGARIAAVHAGWRGVCHGVVAAALDAMPAVGAETTAWIGPAIGACCYEVGEDVAARVAVASRGEVIVRRSPRPHLELGRAVVLQLRRRGVEDVRWIRRCTRCDPRLASFRRDGARSGRNYAVIWRRGERPNARS